MQEAVPVGVGAMAAILGLDAEKVKAGCAQAMACWAVLKWSRRSTSTILRRP